MTSQLDALRAFVGDRPAHASRRIPRVVVFAGGKGGVGTSTVSALVAAGAARAGHETLLVDASGGHPALATLLCVPADGLQSAAPRLTLATLAADETASPSARRASLRRLTARYAGHDLVILDAGSSADGVCAAAAAGAGRLIAVTTDDRLAITAAYALIKYTLDRYEDLPAALLVNGTTPSVASAAYGQVATAVERFLDSAIAPAGSIPFDPAIRESVAAGTSLAPGAGAAAHAASLLAELLIHAARDRRGGRVALQATI